MTVVSAPSDNVFTFADDGFTDHLRGARDARVGPARRDRAAGGRDGRRARPRWCRRLTGRWLAFTLREEVYVAALPPSLETVTLERPQSGPGPFQRVTRDGGQDLKWSDRRLFAELGFRERVLARLELDDVFGPAAPEDGSRSTAGAVDIDPS